MDNEQNLNQNDQNNQLGKKAAKKKRTALIFAVIITILLVITGGGYIYFQNRDKDDKILNPNNDKKDNNNNNNNNTVKVNTYQVASWNGSVTYIPTKQFYKESYDYEYTNVATLKSGETVVRVAIITDDVYEDYFLIDADNAITFLASYSVSNKAYLISEIKIDNKSTIPEIFPENDITYKGQSLEFTYRVYHDLYDGEPNGAVKIESTEFGDLYEYKNFITDEWYVRSIYLKTPDKNEAHYYELKNIDIYNDDRTLKVNWDDNANKTITWEMPVSSCGNDGARLHIKDYTISMGTKIGVTTTGKPLYQLTDDNMLKLLYAEYYNEGEEGQDISFAEFKTKLTSVVYQDDLGEWILLQNDQYSHAGECGKPVIYLYPEKDTYVNIKVGANITVSDPLYNENGWKNVLAKSNGNLIYQGKEYDSLFWEGTGFGPYPNISKIGKVVTQDKLLSTIKKDLKDQGLNEKEIKDFIEFWQDHLTNSPYVKLTWLTTEQMNTLAPLKVNPKPDTVIRVFMDAKGLVEPIPLTSQNFTKIPRKGFTLVEWGGLLKK